MVQGGNRMQSVALRDDIASAPFTLTALGGDAEFELHFVERHSRTRIACNVTVRNSAANANDHGGEGGYWQAVEEGQL